MVYSTEATFFKIIHNILAQKSMQSWSSGFVTSFYLINFVIFLERGKYVRSGNFISLFCIIVQESIMTWKCVLFTVHILNSKSNPYKCNVTLNIFEVIQHYSKFNLHYTQCNGTLFVVNISKRNLFSTNCRVAYLFGQKNILC